MNTPPLPLERRTNSLGGDVCEAVGADALGAPATDWICVAAQRDVLVVDDNDLHLDILCTILSSVGHDVDICGSGAEALRRLETRRYDVVVLDMVMPEISGLVVAQEMRQGELNRRTPVIVCTANIASVRRPLDKLSGISDVISKPIDTANLVLAVARAPVREGKSDPIRL